MSATVGRMRHNGPRLSIVPPAAAFDTRLEALDVRVLLVFGAHTDKQGWCSRSQVKMAQQLGCGRATLQRAIRRLCDAGYLEQKPVVRKDGGDRAHEYRVCFEPETPLSHDFDAEGDEDEGPVAPPAHQRAPLPTSGQGVPTHERAGGAHAIERAPIRTTLPERPFENEGERDAGAGTGEGRGERAGHDGLEIAAFLAVWPTAAVDDPDRMAREWALLSAEDRTAAIQWAGPFLEARKAAKRTTTPSGDTYLRQRRWAQVADTKAATAKAQGSPAVTGVLPAWSQGWQAALIWRAMRGAGGFDLRKMLRMADEMKLGFRPGDDLAAIEASAATLKATRSDSAQALDWADWLESKAPGLGLRARFTREPFFVFLPDHAPPGFGGLTESDDDMAAAMGAK